MSKRRSDRSRAAAGRKKRGSRGGARQVKKSDTLRPKERRQLIQLVACGSIFVLLVAVKLLLPAKLAGFREELTGAMERNIDIQAVFSAVGRAFSGEENAAQDVYQAVFLPEKREEAVKTAMLFPEGADAMDTLRKYRETAQDSTETQALQEAPRREELTTLAYVLYSARNLPENVSLEQAILDFDYCTPVGGTVSSDFGYREHPAQGDRRFHYGVDLAADKGAEICAFADGTVTAVGESSSYGKYCIVSHAGGYTTLYAHCDRIIVTSGREVQRGETIAAVGETGMATGAHLHFELQREGVYLNPVYYLDAA